MGNQDRCGAWCHGRKRRCRQYPVPGKRRCHYHGGASTGAKEGLPRALEAAWAGYRRWDALRRLRGEKRTSGRRKGAGWKTEAMWRRELAAALALGPEEAAAVARELVASRRLAEADAKLLELVKRTEARLTGRLPPDDEIK